VFEDNFADAIASFKNGGRVFAKEVSDPNRFGVVEFNDQKKALSIEEKPVHPKSNFAVTGLYIYDRSVVTKAKTLQPSSRGELEITELNMLYLQEGTLDVSFVEGKWLDTGTFESLFEAYAFIREREINK